jgi:hypothetical protein
MADTITLAFDTPRAQRIGGSGVFGVVSGLATLSSYSSSKVALTALTGYFVPSTGLLRVSPNGVSSNGYALRWSHTDSAFRAYSTAALAPGSVPAAAQITVGSSVFSYTSGTSGPAAPNGEMVTLQPTSTDAVTYTITRGGVTSGVFTATSLGPDAVTLQSGDVLAVTWATGAPTMYSFPFPAPTADAATTLAEVANATNVGTFDFIAVGQMAG